MIWIENLTKRYGFESVLDSTSWRIPERQTVGLVGANGAGKSTLLRILAGEEEPDEGEVIIPRGVTLGYLPQEVEALDDGTLYDIVEGGRQDLIDREEELRQLEIRMNEGEGAELAELYGQKRDDFELDGGYRFRSQAREILVGMGFHRDDFDRHIREFSGGWQMRAMLARLLLQRPSVLLLDEPTNHLDLESLEWLERFLARYEGSVIVVSHDRYFLNRMVDSIVELERGSIETYDGNYDYYREQKAIRRERLAAKAAQQEREIAQIQEFIERFRYKAKKASQVQSRIKKLEKMDKIEGPDSELKTIDFRFPQPPRVGRTVAELREVRKAYGENVVYDSLDFRLDRGDKVALVGPNGAGKSTLLKLLAGVVTPDEGTVELGHKVEVAYFAQHAVDQLDPEKTVLDELWDVAPDEINTTIRSILGAFGFSGRDVEKRVSVLSGGEKSRLALAKLMLAPAGLLIMDEPTNHLDIGSRQTLEFALRTFEGVFVIVSHDRYFIDEVAERVVHVEDGETTNYLGDYSYYRWKREEESAGETDEEVEVETDASGRMSKKDIRRAAAELRKRKQVEAGDLQERLQRIEESIAKLETEIDSIETQLGDPDLYDTPDEATKLNKKHHDLQSKLEVEMVAWEEVAEELQVIEDRYAEEEAKLG